VQVMAGLVQDLLLQGPPETFLTEIVRLLVIAQV
jgi:hypothetical protein